MADKLTDKQQAFVNEYLVDLNATQAATRAGYSEKTAQQVGSENLSKPVIAEAIQKAFADRAERTQLTADRILAEIMKLAFINPKHLYDDEGNLKPIHELSDDVACAIAAVDVGETKVALGKEDDSVIQTCVKKIKFWDKRASLELLGKHLKLFTDKVEHTGNITIEVVKFTDDNDTDSE